MTGLISRWYGGVLYFPGLKESMLSTGNYSLIKIFISSSSFVPISQRVARRINDSAILKTCSIPHLPGNPPKPLTSQILPTGHSRFVCKVALKMITLLTGVLTDQIPGTLIHTMLCNVQSHYPYKIKVIFGITDRPIS